MAPGPLPRERPPLGHPPQGGSPPRTHHHGDQRGEVAVPHGEVAQGRGAAQPSLRGGGGGSKSHSKGGAAAAGQTHPELGRLCPSAWRARIALQLKSIPVATRGKPGSPQPYHPPTPSVQTDSTSSESCLSLSVGPTAPLPTPSSQHGGREHLFLEPPGGPGHRLVLGRYFQNK